MAAVDILLRKWDTGDWKQLVVDGNIYYENHSIPDFIWMELLADVGFPVSTEEVEGEDD